MIRAAIFDLDGVLLDSMGIWKDLGERYVKSRGFEPLPGMSEILFSMSMEQGADYLQSHFPLLGTAAEILAGLEAMLRDFYYEEVAAKPGAEGLLASLRGSGIKMAAATSSPRGHVTAALARNGLLDFMEAIFTTGEVGESKHSPKIYRTASRLLDAPPAQTLVFEDSLYALETAKKAGYRTVGIYDADGESRQEALAAAADWYCRSLLELPGWEELLELR